MSDATGGFRRSDNKVVQGGHPFFETIKVGQTAVTPGALVKRDTSDILVIETAAVTDNVMGVADVIFSEFVDGTRGGQVVGTDLPVGASVRVARGTFLFRGTLASGENATKGMALSAAAGGELQIAVTGENIVAYAEESVNATSAALPILATFCKGGKF